MLDLEKSDYQGLMRLAVKGDAQAYAVLLKETARMLRPFLARHVKSDELDDIIQEILLSVHRARHTYDGNRPYKPWLFAIAYHRLNDFWRRRYGSPLNQYVDIDTLEDFLPAPVTENALSYEDIKGELDQLPGKQGQIVEMMHVEGYTAKEVGKKLDMKESAVKVAAHRAYKKLRERLSGK